MKLTQYTPNDCKQAEADAELEALKADGWQVDNIHVYHYWKGIPMARRVELSKVKEPVTTRPGILVPAGETHRTFFYKAGYEGKARYMTHSIDVLILFHNGCTVTCYCVKDYDFGMCIRATFGYTVNGQLCKESIRKRTNRKRVSQYSAKDGKWMYVSGLEKFARGA